MHVDAARELPDEFAVVAIADSDSAKAQALAAEIGAVALADCEQMASSGQVDVGIVGSPHGLHLQHATALLERGIPVLVEKPMALTSADCRRLIETAERLRVPLAVGHLQRFMPLMIEAKRLLDSGLVGALVSVQDLYSARYEQNLRPGWFFDPSLAGHGILANVGTHCLDRLMVLASTTTITFDSGWMAGEPVPVRAMATGTVDEVRSLIVLQGIGFPTLEVTEVGGASGAIRVSSAEGLTVMRDGVVTHRMARAPEHDRVAFVAQLADFHRAVVAGVRPSVPGEYGLAVVEAIEQIARLAGR